MKYGLVYLIHLDRPLAHSQHYLGWTTQLLQKRLDQHKKGQGAKFLQIAVNRGIRLLLVRVWYGPQTLERTFKNRKYARKLCPLCNEPQKVCQPRIGNAAAENRQSLSSKGKAATQSNSSF